jgi:NitT/TauT family transport system ATP-binding protein
MATLSLQDVGKQFRGRNGEICALQNICLDVRDGEFLVLIGPSGCGKSTLLNIIAGLDTATSGQVLENGTPVRGPGRDRSVVFQEGALFPWLTAQKNVEFGLKQMGVPPKERAERAAHYLHLVHLSRFRESYLHELSGGMRQRVAIARALALDPGVLLMDEPFSALDAQTRDDLYLILQEIWERTRKTIVFVTHNVREAVCLADRVVLMAPQPGRIEAVFPIRLARPRFIDDVDVIRLAQQVSDALKSGLAKMREEEYDADWQPAERGLLRSSDGMLGDSI